MDVAEEKVDLEEARKQEILALESKVATSNHFEFLGVPEGAPIEEVKAAFREASRKFHPDRYFGKNLGSFRAKLDRVFKRLVEANQTLVDPHKREAYLAANPFLRAAGSSSAPQLKTKAEEERDEERRRRLAKHPYLARTTKVQEFLAKAKAHVAAKEYSQAITHLTNASQVDPTHAEVKALLVEVRKSAELARSDSSYEHALEALSRGDDELAIQALRGSVNANALNFKAAHKLAILLEKRREVREATLFAQKAVDAAPGNVELRVHLAQLLTEAGMKAMAKKHFEEAAKLNPDHPEVKKHGKKLWPF